uniref:Uncharacterized protein n=1 Tax=Leptocylindrus danicus TaxID=163516 RepID=A0A6U2NRM9_9STRA|mmetsp:Transcript_22101/g.33154  ORF Transcript_22101/g.33154 Transcript_22101/m.33154 type:complete len:157 (+) Transcript_22101:439-909(+)
MFNMLGRVTSNAIASSRLGLPSLRIGCKQISSRFRTVASLGSDLRKKEHIEEEKFIRDREKAIMKDARKAREEDAEQTELASSPFEALIDNAMSELHDVLDMTGDAVSPEGSRNIANWFLGDSINEVYAIANKSNDQLSEEAVKNIAAWKEGVLKV